MEKNCIGKESCELRNYHAYLPIGKQASPMQDCEINEDTSIFFQYKCVDSDENILHKRNDCLISACVAVFGTLVCLSIVNYSQNSVAVSEREWDLQTKTAADYTLQIFDIWGCVQQMKEEIAHL